MVEPQNHRVKQVGIEFRPYQGEADHPTIARFDQMGLTILGFTDPPAQLCFAMRNTETVGYGRVWLKPFLLLLKGTQFVVERWAVNEQEFLPHFQDSVNAAVWEAWDYFVQLLPTKVR